MKGSSRDKRVLLAEKAPRTKVGTGVPNKAEGNNGDLQVRQINNKIKLFVKYKGIWHGVNVGKSFDKVEKKSEDALTSKDLFSNRNQVATNDIVSDADFTLDTSGDIALSADGDQITMDDGQGNTRFTFNLDSSPEIDVHNTGFVLDCAGTAKIECSLFTIDASTDITLDAAGGCIDFKDNDVQFAQIDSGGGGGTLYLYDDASTSDYLRLHCLESGVSTLSTVDSNGTVAHLTIAPNGNLILDPDSKITTINESIVFNTQTHQDITSGGIAVDWNNGNKQSLDITGTGYTVTMTNPAGPCNLILKVIQGDGADTITTWAASSGSVYWAGGVIPTLSTGNGEIDIMSFYFDGTNYFATATHNFATV